MRNGSRHIILVLTATVALCAATLCASDGLAQSSPPQVTPKVAIPASFKTKEQVRREKRALSYAPRPFQPKPPCLACAQ